MGVCARKKRKKGKRKKDEEKRTKRKKKKTKKIMGKKKDGRYKSENGYWESHGKKVTPRSLYFKQLEDRLGADALNLVNQ